MIVESPFMTTYWVKSGSFLAGAHPIAISRSMTIRQTLQYLVRIPLVTFIDLTASGETQSYAALLEEETLDLYPSGVYWRKAIGDDGIPTIEEMQNILNIIDASLASQQSVYLHCYSGIGRTGTVVGCYLVRHGEPSVSVLSKLARLRQGTLDAGSVSPRTAKQQEFVCAWRQGT